MLPSPRRLVFYLNFIKTIVILRFSIWIYMPVMIPPHNSLRVMNNDDLNAYSIKRTNSSVHSLITPWISIPADNKKWRWVFTSLIPASLVASSAEKASMTLAQAFAFMRQELTNAQEVIRQCTQRSDRTLKTN